MAVFVLVAFLIFGCCVFFSSAFCSRFSKTSASRMRMGLINDAIGAKLKVFKKFAPLIGFYAVMLSPIYGIGLYNGPPGKGFGDITEFRTLRNRSPEGVLANECIVCPETFCPKVEHSRIQPQTYGVSADELITKFDEVIRSQDRISVIDSRSKSPLKKEYVQRTLIFRFPDVITVEAIPLESKKSTFALHSYSIYGAGDLGVNADRVNTIIKAVNEDVPPQ